MNKTDTMVNYLINEYSPQAVVVYGSFADSSNNLNSDFDALIIADGVNKLHDGSIVDSTQLDVFIYPPEKFTADYSPADYVQIFDGKIVLDKYGVAKKLQASVLSYIETYPKKSAEENRNSVSWCEKMLKRAERGDTEGFYRWHWLLFDSLEIYYDLRGEYYFGPKKSLKKMEATDPDAFRIYSRALKEFNMEALTGWVNYLTEYPID